MKMGKQVVEEVATAIVDKLNKDVQSRPGLVKAIAATADTKDAVTSEEVLAAWKLIVVETLVEIRDKQQKKEP